MIRCLALSTALLGALLAGCGSNCAPACDVLGGGKCPHVQFNGQVRTGNSDDCQTDCHGNQDSICADASNATANQAVLDCVAAVDCTQDSAHAQLAIEQCVLQCPTHR